MSSKRRIRRHSCTKKVAYETQDAAAAAVRRIKLEGVIFPYKCSFCGKYHNGRPPRNVRKSIKERRGYVKA